tara:strand:+ start:388 stop:507 length:120 start_codon:yes stop_codon:yes gene_type:complete
MAAAELALWTRIQMELLELQTQAAVEVLEVQLKMQAAIR